MQCVRFEYFEARFFAPSFAKVCGKNCIEFYRGDAISMSQQTFSQSTAARADLDHERRVIAARSLAIRSRVLPLMRKCWPSFWRAKVYGTFFRQSAIKNRSFTVAAQ